MTLSDDDDDLDEENIPGFSHPAVVSSPQPPVVDKGKGRATDQLATPTGGDYSRSQLSGNIGSAQNNPSSASRRTVGGVQVETRYARLTEPVL